MVIVDNWTIKDDFLITEIEVSGYPRRFKATYKISTEDMQTSEVLPDSVRSATKRAIATVYVEFSKGKIKMGRKRGIAWG